MWIELILKPSKKFLRKVNPKLRESEIQGLSILLVFLVSGIVHEYYIFVAFGRITGDQLKFFLVQSFFVILEKRIEKKIFSSKIFGFCLTFILNGLTASFFIEPWIEFFGRGETLKYSLFVPLLKKVRFY